MTSPGTTPKIAIWEDDPSGHRLAYVELLVKYIHKNTGMGPLVVMSEEVKKSSNYELILKNIEGEFETAVIGDETCKGPFQTGRRLFKVLDYLRKRGISVLLMSTADVSLQVLGLTRWVGLVPRHVEIRCVLQSFSLPYADRPFLRQLRDWISFWLKKLAPVKAFYLDGYAADLMRQKYGFQIQTIPEPLLSLPTEWPLKHYKKDPGSPDILWFGCLGRFDARKGADMLLDAFQQGVPPHWGLCLAGPMLDRSLIRKAETLRAKLGGRLIFRDEVLGNDEFWKTLQQLDIICLPYRRHVGQSGIYTQAATLNKVILGSDYGWLGGEGRKYNKINLFNDGSLPSLIDCMKKTAAEFESLSKIQGNFQPNSADSFARVLCGF